MLENPTFWVGIAFIAFIGILIYQGVPAMLNKALDARADVIRAELDEARRLREEARSILGDYQRKHREAEDEAKAIVAQARREAEVLAEETRKGLQETLERRTRLAEDKIGRAEAQAIGEVRAAAVDMAVSAAEKILREKTSGAAGVSLTDQSIRDLKGRMN